MKDLAVEIYKTLKLKRIKYNEEVHCPMLLEVMMDKKKGYHSAFCTKALIGEDAFYNWLSNYEFFREVYCLAKMFARQNWEEEGWEIRDEIHMQGVSNNKLDVWKMWGWARYGIGKNARIRLELNPESKPDQHYAQLLRQAAKGDFTAGEIKQLMEAINVGLNTHQTFALQLEIDQLKADLATMNENSNANNNFPNQGIAKED